MLDLEIYKPPSDRKMRGKRYLDPEDYCTACVALRDVYAEIADPESKKKLRYASMITDIIVHKLREYDPEWLKSFYPKRKEYDEIMRDK